MARGFSEGYAPVANSKVLWGYINKNGTVVINYQYNFTDMFIDGKARVMLNGNMMMIDKKGNQVKEEN